MINGAALEKPRCRLEEEGYKFHHLRGDPRICWGKDDIEMRQLNQRLDEIALLEKEAFPELFSAQTRDNRLLHKSNLNQKSTCVFFVVSIPSDHVVSFVFTTHQAGQVRLTSLATDAAHRKRELASRVIQAALGYNGRFLKCSSALLIVRSSNREARCLYSNSASRHPTMLAFKKVKTIRNYYENGGDAIEMTMETIGGKCWEEGASLSLNRSIVV